MKIEPNTFGAHLSPKLLLFYQQIGIFVVGKAY